jgi:hypothetical protein
MPRETIQVDSEVFSIEDIPEGATTEAAGEEGSHTDVEYQESIESAGDEESVSLEAISQWRVGKCLLVLKKQIDGIAPRRNRASDGTIGDRRHCGGPNPSSDHCPKVRDGNTGVVTAMDITHDPGEGCDAEKIAESIRADRDPRVKYVIWNKRIFASYPVDGKQPWTWRAYGGSNPHTKHVHVSVKADKANYDSQEAWNLSELQAIG